jgi:glycosyltransferase involved in cell wall biosynthesis
MRIAQIATISAPVCKDTTGSVESLGWLLTRELSKLGHQVTVFGTAGSVVDGELVATSPGPYARDGALEDWHLCEWVNLCKAVAQSGRFDVLHTHSYLWGIPLQPLSRAPLVHTTHIVPDDDTAKLWSGAPASCVTAISGHQWSAFPELKPVAVIPHGVDVDDFTFNEKPADYVLFLGRFVSGKGPMLAIETARKLGLKLKLAGPSNPYFREKIQPLVDGQNVEYVGFVTGRDRNQLLGGARALIYPIQYPEAFGLVLVEAMLCGTPIAGMRLGAVPEIVEEGISGFVSATREEFADIVPKCFSLDRRVIQQRAREKYSAEQMARQYVSVYEQACRGNNT